MDHVAEDLFELKWDCLEDRLCVTSSFFSGPIMDRMAGRTKTLCKNANDITKHMTLKNDHVYLYATPLTNFISHVVCCFHHGWRVWFYAPLGFVSKLYNYMVDQRQRP
jgi:hypothetical protein